MITTSLTTTAPLTRDGSKGGQAGALAPLSLRTLCVYMRKKIEKLKFEKY